MQACIFLRKTNPGVNWAIFIYCYFFQQLPQNVYCCNDNMTRDINHDVNLSAHYAAK